MKLTGIETPFEGLSSIEPNTVLVVIANEQGTVKVVKIDPASIAEGDAKGKHQSGTATSRLLGDG